VETFRNSQGRFVKGVSRPPVSEETGHKISMALTGKRLSDEHRHKLSLARIGKPSWNKGLSKETDERVKNYGVNVSKALRGNLTFMHEMSEKMIDFNSSDLGRKLRSKSQREMWEDKDYREKQIVKIGFVKGRKVWSKGLTKATDSRIRLSSEKRFSTMKENDSFHRGENHYNWKGGIPKLYPSEFNKELKEKVRGRYEFSCAMCGTNKQLCVHHIDSNKNNNHLMNLMCLCVSCHMKIQHWKIDFTKCVKYVIEDYNAAMRQSPLGMCRCRNLGPIVPHMHSRESSAG